MAGMIRFRAVRIILQAEHEGGNEREMMAGKRRQRGQRDQRMDPPSKDLGDKGCCVLLTTPRNEVGNREQ